MNLNRQEKRMNWKGNNSHELERNYDTRRMEHRVGTLR